MVQTAVGRPVNLTYDYDGPCDKAPVEGDVLMSLNGTAVYRVLKARQVRSTVHPCRWALECVRIMALDIEADDNVFGLVWKGRHRRRVADPVLYSGQEGSEHG